MKKFGEIEAKYLKIGWLELLVFLSLWAPLFLAQTPASKTWETTCKRKKKNIFYSDKDEQ